MKDPPICEPDRVLRFGDFDVNPVTGELHKFGVRIPLEQQPFKILLSLLLRPGQVVSREELKKSIWPSVDFGDFEHAINVAVTKLRAALCDQHNHPRYIETLHKRGYRFIANVECPAETEAHAAESHVGKVDLTRDDLEPAAIGRGGRKLASTAVELPANSNQPKRYGLLDPIKLQPKGAQSASSSSDARRSFGFRSKWISAVAALTALFAGIGLLHYWLEPAIETEARNRQQKALKVVPLTALSGHVISPTFSPDGNQVAFGWDGENDRAGYDLYVKQIGTDRPIRLTRRPAKWLAAEWSHDGRAIAISRLERADGAGIYVLPATGGPERKLTARVSFGLNSKDLSWSPDGKLIAFTDHPAAAPWERSLQLFTLSLDTLERTQIETGCSLVTTPAFSPRGDLLAWVCVDSWSSFSIHTLRLSDGSMTKLFDGADGVGGLGWSRDGQRIIFTSPLDFGDLQELSISRPNFAEKLPVGHDASDIAVSPSVGRLAYVQGFANVNIWRMDLRDAASAPRKLITSSREQKAPSISPDQTSIAFESNRSGSNELWVCDADGLNAVQLTSFGVRATGTPRWSPDGKVIAFDSRVGGEANIYLIDPNRRVSRKLNIQNVSGNNMPSWSRDGKWIYFVHGEDAHNPSVWKVGSEGGKAVEVARTPSTYPIESPDGRYLYFVRNWRLWRATTDGSNPEEVKASPPLQLLGDKWVPFGTGVYFLSDINHKTVLDFFDLVSQRTHRVKVLEGAPPAWMGQMSVSSDGRWLVYPQSDQSASNLAMVEGWQ